MAIHGWEYICRHFRGQISQELSIALGSAHQLCQKLKQNHQRAKRLPATFPTMLPGWLGCLLKKHCFSPLLQCPLDTCSQNKYLLALCVI